VLSIWEPVVDLGIDEFLKKIDENFGNFVECKTLKDVEWKTLKKITR
jgi:hypothetical protein